MLGLHLLGFKIKKDRNIYDGVVLFVYQCLGEDIHIENLRPNWPYIFRFRAKNEVGVRNYYEYTHTTEDIRTSIAQF